MTTENKKPDVGTEIPSNDNKYPIASWNARDGGFLAKIFFCKEDSSSKGCWFAVSNQQYGADGLIVFIKVRPTIGQKLKIKKVSNKVAFADVV
jgi:hypothetical protein